MSPSPNSRPWSILQATITAALLALVVVQIAQLGSSPSASERRLSPRVTVLDPASLAGAPAHGSYAVELPDSAPARAQQPQWRLAPPLAAHTRWDGERRLLVDLLEAPRDATAYELVAKLPGQAANAGAGIRIPLFTKPLRVREVLFDQSSPVGSPVLLLAFGAPVHRDALAAALRIHAEDGAAIPYQVREAGGIDDEPAFRVQLSVAPGAAEPRAVELSVLGSLRSADGVGALAGPVRQRVELGQPLRLTGVEARPGRIEITFNQATALPPRELIEVEPPAAVQIVRSRRGIRLLGDLPAGRTFRVTLKRGFPGSGRAQLPAEDSRTVRIPDAKPSLQFTQEGQVLSAKAMLDIELGMVNITRYEISARKIYENNVLAFLRDDARGRLELDEVAAPAVKRVRTVAAPRNERAIERVDLRELLGPEPRGVFHLAAAAVQGEAQDERILQITDLGVTVREGDGKACVRVESLALGTPVAAASVRVVSRTSQILGEGATDSRGIAQIAWNGSGGDRSAALVEVRTLDDAAWVDLSRFAMEQIDDAVAGIPYARERAEVFLAFDRGLVRPGESLRATVVARDGRGRAPGAIDLEATWRGAKEKLLRKTALTLDAYGVAVCELSLEADAPEGYVQLEIARRGAPEVLGRATARVESFVPSRMEAWVSPVESSGGDDVAVRVRARWLDGAPAAGCSVRAFATLLWDTTPPKGFDAFRFVPISLPPPPGAQPSIASALDARGEAVLRLPALWGSRRLPMIAQITAEVSEPGGRAITARATIPWAPPLRIGIRATAQGAEIVAIDRAGALADGPLRAQVRLLAHRVVWNLLPSRNGRLRHQREEQMDALDAAEANLAGGRASVSFPSFAIRDGQDSYVLSAQIGETCAQAEFAVREAASPRAHLRGPARPIRPGGTAICELMAPRDGSALMTLEGSTLHAAWTVAVRAGRNEIPVPIPEDATDPNLYAVASCSAPQASAPKEPARQLAIASIPLDHSQRRLTPKITVPGRLEPGGTVRISLDAPGARRAVVTLVDEAVARRAGDRIPDPARRFAAHRRLETRGADTGVALLSGVRFDPSVRVGGDGGDEEDEDGERDTSAAEEGTTSLAIRPLALVLSEISLDADGRGEAVATLPEEFEGQARICCIAAGLEGVGSASASIAVAGRLQVRAALPRFLAPGDVVESDLWIRNSTEEPRVLQVQLASEGLDLLEPRGASFSLALAPGAHHVGKIRLRARAASAGGSHETVRIEGRAVAPFRWARLGASFAAHGRPWPERSELVTERRLEIATVVRDLTLPARVEIGAIIENRSQLELPDDLLSSGGKITLRVVDGPDAALAPLARSLVEYPHGCVEQTASRGFAMLAAGALLQRLSDESATLDLEGAVRAAVARLLSMQTAEGSLAAWPDLNTSDLFGSIYGLDFLLYARSRGLEVPDRSLARLASAVERVLAAGNPQSTAAARCYAVEVLAATPLAVGSWIEELSALGLGREERLRLTLACARVGNLAHARVELARALATPEESRHGTAWLRSPVRTLALELRARLAVNPGDAVAVTLLENLTKMALRPDRWSTQEQASALRALSDGFSTRASSNTGGNVEVRLGDEKVTISPSHPATLPIEGARRIEFTTDRPSVVLASVRGRRKPIAGAALTEANPMRITRRVVDVATAQPPMRLQRGCVYEVALEVAPAPEQLLVSDLLPAGLELEVEPESAVALSGAPPSSEGVLRVDRRDDRILIFGAASSAPKLSIRYRVRAVFSGEFAAGATHAQALYDSRVESLRVEEPRTTILR
ncbi:MAG: hypothetical protein JNJ88_10610 [Planctomycetes bacterium]|nr:hypothetical protein [Planctomycetota bacterium]